MSQLELEHEKSFMSLQQRVRYLEYGMICAILSITMKSRIATICYIMNIMLYKLDIKTWK